ncbi:hypothetical protein ACLK19_23935 [Escherichia coli]
MRCRKTRQQRFIRFADFCRDPLAHPLKTAAARLKSSQRIADYSYQDCPGHAMWLEPDEIAGQCRTRTVAGTSTPIRRTACTAS